MIGGAPICGALAAVLSMAVGVMTARADAKSDCVKKSGAEAVSACNQVIRQEPRNAAAYNARGIAQGNIDEALSDYTKAINLDPKLTNAYFNRALAHKQKGDLDRAIADYSKVIDLEPNDAGAYNGRGNTYGSKGDADRAIADLSRAIDLDPKFALAYTNRGIAMTAKGDLDLAIADFSKSIEFDPKFALAYKCLGEAQSAKGDVDQPIANFAKAIEIDPDYADAYAGRGKAYIVANDLDRALADLSKSIELDPSQADAYDDRGRAHILKNDLDQAIADFTKAIELGPEFAEAYGRRGIAYERKGDSVRAIADYTKAAERDATDARFMDLGLARLNSGDFKGASSDLLRSIELKDNIYAMLFRYLAKARAGESAEADLEANATRLKTKEWPYAVIELYLGKRSADATSDLADKPDQKCEAHYYVGEWHVLKGNKADAEAALKTAIDTCPKDFIESWSAIAEMKRLNP